MIISAFFYGANFENNMHNRIKYFIMSILWVIVWPVSLLYYSPSPKKLFRKYKKSNILKERLILNHIILIYNVFGVEAATRILFFRIDERDYDILKTFLLYLNYMPDRVEGINGKNIDSSTIMVDMNIAEILRKL